MEYQVVSIKYQDDRYDSWYSMLYTLIKPARGMRSFAALRMTGMTLGTRCFTR